MALNSKQINWKKSLNLLTARATNHYSWAKISLLSSKLLIVIGQQLQPWFPVVWSSSVSIVPQALQLSHNEVFPPTWLGDCFSPLGHEVCALAISSSGDLSVWEETWRQRWLCGVPAYDQCSRLHWAFDSCCRVRAYSRRCQCLEFGCLHVALNLSCWNRVLVMMSWCSEQNSRSKLQRGCSAILKKGKSAGIDNIPAKLVKAVGEDVITAVMTICNKIW